MKYLHLFSDSLFRIPMELTIRKDSSLYFESMPRTSLCKVV